MQAPTSQDSRVVGADRLASLEKTVSDLTRRLDAIENGNAPARQHSAQLMDEGDGPAPVVLLRDVAEEVGRSPEHGRVASARSTGRNDIISRGIITYETALPLVAIYQEHYGRWVALSPDEPLGDVVDHLRESPLLFCASCLIAVRHMDALLAAKLAEPLFAETKRLLADAMLTVPQAFEFFKATVILSYWSTTIGSTPLSLDSWLISGIALQQCLASAFPSKPGNASQEIAMDRQTLDRRCVWNHICLAHLHYAVGTRRTSILDHKQIEQARLILGVDGVTEFEIRIVAEIELYWVVYEHCCTRNVDLPRAQAALRAWRNEWARMFQQPRSTFLRMGLHFAQLVAYDQSMRSRSSAVRESLLVEMIQTSLAILDLAVVTTDDRTKHLSDHIYHLIAFAAVTICRLLHKYEQQLASAYEAHELDEVVLRIVTWLHSVGPSCHVGHTFGDLVAGLHKKLRPNAHLTSPTLSYQGVDPFHDTELVALFPDLLSTELLTGPTPELLADWQGFSENTNGLDVV